MAISYVISWLNGRNYRVFKKITQLNSLIKNKLKIRFIGSFVFFFVIRCSLKIFLVINRFWINKAFKKCNFDFKYLAVSVSFYCLICFTFKTILL